MTREKLLIANEWVDAADTLTVRSPYSGEIVGEVARASAAEMERALTAAVRAFEKTRRLSSARRTEILRNAVHGIARRRDEFARTIALESAKPIKLARGEVDRGLMTFSLASEEAARLGGEVLPLDLIPAAEGRMGITRRFPLGPVLAISPFNFPLNLVAHKVAPSMAVGNSLVHKPASSTPLTAILLGRVLLEAGMPPGMVNVTPCAASLADTLVADERFKLVTFTGSPAVGWPLKQKAGKKRALLELGGNAALIVHEDADLDRAVDRAVFGAFAYAGQVCISIQRIYLHEKIADAFTQKFVEQTRKLVAGDPLDEKTDLCPMIDEASLVKTQEWVDEAVRGGARALTGGKRDGRFFPATVLENVKPDMRVHGQEVFAPVVNLYRYRDFEEALAAADDSSFGLQAGVFTRDLGRVFRAFERLEVGGVIHNDAPTFRIDVMPYGGEKDSGQGREGVRYAIEEMTELRLLALNLKS
jgi:glyceraldehyde-3-phosphate dehydrogenase (NADP+)